MWIEYNCLHCKILHRKQVSKSSVKINRSKFCSRKCMDNYKKSHRVKKQCLNCNKPLLLKHSLAYLSCCSKKCSVDLHRTHHNNKSLIKKDKLLCIRCDAYKPFDEFHDSKVAVFQKYRNGKFKYCKLCTNIVTNGQYKKRISTIEGTIGELFKRSKSASKISTTRKNHDFDITKNYLLELYENQKGKCAISGVVLESSDNYNYKAISVDRIDSSKGYIKDNVQLVCWIVNQMKNDMKLSDLKQWCILIANN